MKVCVIYSNAKVEDLKKKQKIKHNFNMELVAKHINADNKLKKQAVFVLGSLFYVQDVVSASGDLAKIDKAGNTILGIARKIGYWVCIIGCIIDIIRSLMQGDTKSIAKIMMKYALAFAALYIFPWMLDLIRSIF
ncbi:hypothetical protein [Clostridium botulinum]|uniref:hypothetical protein n=1 Tax=Clostridium botulinum TaxID=1491 RepID=UPI0004D01680|nr:hypothetical protein [Clostridium botulinum]APC82171.1 hypothetical protein NPD12_3725 [Clostridium botulinum]AXG97776.1 hypothetical protein AGE31_19490 [Clostridium botulinum]MBY6773581.1 hypothetical protein [Clostridium botulinum]MBY6886099.1 hypothetical protein [Clostridium botulinum]HBJ1682517.1 hypothetical protein [Clostridium botulinum]